MRIYMIIDIKFVATGFITFVPEAFFSEGLDRPIEPPLKVEGGGEGVSNGRGIVHDYRYKVWSL